MPTYNLKLIPILAPIVPVHISLYRIHFLLKLELKFRINLAILAQISISVLFRFKQAEEAGHTKFIGK